MCGIVGIKGALADQTTDQKFITAMDSIKHRGPDDIGHWRHPSVLLGHTRLSILDLTARGHQPMLSSDGRYILVFNGEIFNFQQLRKELTDLGVQFQSSGDSEVLLAAMIYWGTDTLNKLNGMFAFAFYDSLQDRVILARDRFGIKPLFYQHSVNGLVFASEIKPMRQLFNGQPLNYQAAGHYLKLGYNYAPYTIWQGIQKLLPGHYLIHEKGETEVKKWYFQNHSVGNTADFNTSKEEMVTILEDAVRSRMISDVPMGAFLSGGIDSSIVVGLMRRITNAEIKTFTVTYKNAKNYDESEYARIVANHFDTKHHELEVELDKAQKSIPAILDYLDEPFADPSLIPTYLICKEIKKHITVALSGDGADEVFAGYRKYLGEYYMNQWWVPLASAMLKYPLKVLPASRRNFMTEYIRKIKRFFSGMDPNPVNRYLNWASLAPDETVQAFTPFQINPSEQIKEKITNLRDEIAGSDNFNKVLYTDQSIVLEGNMLPKVDMMSMFNGLEVRSPFMDYRVIQCANSMPSHYKFHKGIAKYILKQAFKDILPAEIQNRRKQGFDIPVGEWFRDGYKDMFWDVISNADTKKGINKYAVEPIYKQHINEVNDNSRILWSVFVWSWWWNRHF